MEKLSLLLFRWLENTPEDTHEEYLKNLPDYKAIVDKVPSEFLHFRLDNAIRGEQYELAAYIKKVAEVRGFELKQIQES